MSELIDFEHKHGDKAITINKMTYPLAQPVSNYIAKHEAFYEAIQKAINEYEGYAHDLERLIDQATNDFNKAW